LRDLLQLPEDENERLVDPKPPRDVDELEVELLGRLVLLVCEGDRAVETELGGRLEEIERGPA
jgi:hypothetical protein